MNFIKWLVETLVKMIGPPDVDDEITFREYCRKVVYFLRDLAKLTKTEIDDEIMETLQQVIVNDESWEQFYQIVVKLFGDGVADASRLTPAQEKEIQTLASQMNIPWRLLLQAILLIVQIISEWRS